MEPNHFHVHPWNATDEELVYRQRDRFEQPSPAAVQDILGIFATCTGMARDRIRLKRFAKLLFQAATIRTAIKHGNYVASPSMAIQKVMGVTLGVLGEWLGYKAVDPKYVGE